MPLPTMPCMGKFSIDVTNAESAAQSPMNFFFECIKVKKVFDEFGLRDCVEGIRFELCDKPKNGEIEPTLILRNCVLKNVIIADASKRSSNGYLIEKRLRFSGKCCCEVYGKDSCGNVIRMKVTELPNGTKFSIGPYGELCYSFNVRREYVGPNSICPEDFERLLHFIEEGRFELQCLEEAIIDDENNETCDEVLTTSLGLFLVVKFDTEVQLCVPVTGYCQVLEDEQNIEEGFCEDVFPCVSFPEFNPPQLFSFNGDADS